LAPKEIGVRDVFAGQEIAFSVGSALQCRHDACGDVIDVDDRETAARVTGHAVTRDLEHCMSERMREGAGTVDDSGVYDDDANSVASRVGRFLFGQSLALVVHELQRPEVVRCRLVDRRPRPAEPDGGHGRDVNEYRDARRLCGFGYNSRSRHVCAHDLVAPPSPMTEVRSKVYDRVDA